MMDVHGAITKTPMAFVKVIIIMTLSIFLVLNLVYCSVGDCDPRYTKKRKGDGTCQCHTSYAGGRCRECHPSHFGDKCENCHLGYHKVGSACIEGNCSATGTKARKPNGICQCLPGFVGSSCEDCATGHTGPACSQCLPGYYLDGNNGCLEGFCAPYGTEAETGGACQCKVGFTGSLCDRCDPAYHRVDNYCHGTLFIIIHNACFKNHHSRGCL